MRKHTRRTVLSTTAVGLAALAGCTGSSDQKAEAPDPDTAPSELLPYNEEWTPVNTGEIVPSNFGGDSGVWGVYSRNQEEYQLVVCRYSSEELAQERFSAATDPNQETVVIRGVFGFAAAGPNDETVRSLLEASPAIESVSDEESD